MKTNEMKRGDEVVSEGGAIGRFVGLRGIKWICWDADRFLAMCAAFDAAAR